ncbi:dual specificity protein phosphatase family protein [Halodesulfovibrio sp.]|uniref:phosphatase domain-containing putative toxin n=1 Tax=Halodesulfovibrio sp. TaxID=1912772 RepID=UPI0025CBE022|nr:dual specificity protein phosphatase family protein [Halodesulfovibrio sp.]MCT4536226.1 dual specificity protein phosphatase family protein [Halodesulfovibrio sp.]
MIDLRKTFSRIRSTATRISNGMRRGVPFTASSGMEEHSVFPVHYVSSRLALGPAPSTQQHFAAIKEQKISCILNLCAELKELPALEEKAGFEVYFLPIEDEEAPDLLQLEKALEWIDEQMFLGKHVYIHCRHGIGRTGTVFNAYLLRRGLGHRRAAKMLHKLRAEPTNFAQWRAVRNYGAHNPPLSIKAPTLEFGEETAESLAPFLSDYMQLQKTADTILLEHDIDSMCGTLHNACCHSCVPLTLIEALALATHLNTSVPSAARAEIITRAAEVVRLEQNSAQGLSGTFCLYNTDIRCPLLSHGTCLLYAYRPLRCRLFGITPEVGKTVWEDVLHTPLEHLSSQVSLNVTGTLPNHTTLMFTIPEVLSGKYVQRLFSSMKEK